MVPFHCLAAVRMQGFRDSGIQGCREPLAAELRIVVKIESSRANFPSPACMGRSCKHKSSSRPAKLAEVFLQEDFPAMQSRWFYVDCMTAVMSALIPAFPCHGCLGGKVWRRSTPGFCKEEEKGAGAEWSDTNLLVLFSGKQVTGEEGEAFPSFAPANVFNQSHSGTQTLCQPLWSSCKEGLLSKPFKATFC